ASGSFRGCFVVVGEPERRGIALGQPRPQVSRRGSMVASQRSARPAWIFLAVAACADTRDRTGRAAQADTPCSWHMVTAADFNADGLSDVIWNDASCNRMTVSLFRGTHLLEQGPEIAGPRGGGWLTVTAADFNLDGMADVSWYSPDARRAAVWLMRATHE